MFRKIFGIDWLWLDFGSNTNRTKKRIQTTFITLNSTPTGLFTAADLTSFDTVISCIVIILQIYIHCIKADLKVKL